MTRDEHPANGRSATMTPVRLCKLCGRPIVYATTNTGRRIPLDAEPHQNGTVILLADGHCSIVGISRTDPRALRYLAHSATCELGVAQLPSRRT